MTTTRVQLWCAWCAPVFVVLFFAGAIMASIVPPPSPTDTPAQVAQFWGTNTDLKRAGLWLMMLGAGLTGPFGIALTIQIKRIEGRTSPMHYMQLMGATLGVFTILMPVMLFMAASYRPGRTPEVTAGLMDAAFVPFVLNYPPALIQFTAFAVAVLLQKGPNPVFPRWLAWYTLWTCFLFLPGALLLFFTTGAWAWNGLLTFWLVAAIFGGWFLTVFVFLRRAIIAQAPAMAAEAAAREADDAAGREAVAGAPAAATAEPVA